ncbi:MAG: restriction endonuclease [Lachnospiraceae bacterium]|nr:restriction endonuclease [Lachnospiraceae bacterium]
MLKRELILAAVILVMAYLFCHWILKKMKLKPLEADRTVDEIDQMTGIEFEHFVAAVLKGCGFIIEEMTKTSGDYGADIIVSFNGVRIAVQCKRYHHPVGVKAVQEVISAMKHYDCEEAIVITNNYFTQQAEILAKDYDMVSLYDRKQLLYMRDQAVQN